MTTTAALTLVLLAGLVVVAFLAWLLPARRLGGRAAAAVLVAGLGLIGLVALLKGPLQAGGEWAGAVLLVNLFLLAVAGGGPLTAVVLTLVDRGPVGERQGAHAEEVLRGGAWIGAFERAAVFATLAAGWPEGLAVVLALKGLGRYSELRADASSTGAGAAGGTPPARHSGGVAERFLIGSFASLLWAVGCAGALLALA